MNQNGQNGAFGRQYLSQESKTRYVSEDQPVEGSMILQSMIAFVSRSPLVHFWRTVTFDHLL